MAARSKRNAGRGNLLDVFSGTNLIGMELLLHVSFSLVTGNAVFSLIIESPEIVLVLYGCVVVVVVVLSNLLCKLRIIERWCYFRRILLVVSQLISNHFLLCINDVCVYLICGY